MHSILICDDEADIVSALCAYLGEKDRQLYCAYDGVQALEVLQNRQIHLVLLDVMMPHMDGLETLRRIRETSNVPVILLTARGEQEDKVRGLDCGADDYVTKPFDPRELRARVQSQLRRYTCLGGVAQQQGQYTVGGITLDDREKTVLLDGKAVALTPLEYDILLLLMQHPGRVFPPGEIYRLVWKEEPLGGENTVAVHIRHLREKLEYAPAEPRYLKVVWGKGYKIEQER